MLLLNRMHLLAFLVTLTLAAGLGLALAGCVAPTPPLEPVPKLAVIETPTPIAAPPTPLPTPSPITFAPDDKWVFAPLDRLEADKLSADTLYLVPPAALSAQAISTELLAKAPSGTLALAPRDAISSLPKDAMALVTTDMPGVSLTGTLDFVLTDTLVVSSTRLQFLTPNRLSGASGLPDGYRLVPKDGLVGSLDKMPVLYPGPGDCPECSVGDWCLQRGCPWYCSPVCSAKELMPPTSVTVSPTDPLVFVPVDQLDASKLPTDTLYLAPAEALNSALISRAALAQLPTNTLALAPAAAFANLPMDALAQVQPVTPTTGTQDSLSLVPTMTLQISEPQLIIPGAASSPTMTLPFSMTSLAPNNDGFRSLTGRRHSESRCDRCRHNCTLLCRLKHCC